LYDNINYGSRIIDTTLGGNVDVENGSASTAAEDSAINGTSYLAQKEIEWETVADAAERTGITRAAIYQKVNKGEIRALRVESGAVLVVAQDVVRNKRGAKCHLSKRYDAGCITIKQAAEILGKNLNDTRALMASGMLKTVVCQGSKYVTYSSLEAYHKIRQYNMPAVHKPKDSFFGKGWVPAKVFACDTFHTEHLDIFRLILAGKISTYTSDIGTIYFLASELAENGWPDAEADVAAELARKEAVRQAEINAEVERIIE
jgi:excisionase family DNA binding protein